MKKLTKDNITAAIKIRDDMLSWNQVDKLLLQVFRDKKENIIPHTIGYKIELVNKLYNCHLTIDKKLVAKEIQKLDLDSLFREKKTSPEIIVKEIAELQPKPYKRTVGPVFASKYCHFHHPEIFPIYDKFARIALSDVLEKKKGEYDGKYALFKSDLDNLMKSLSWKTSYKEMDKYLWLYGQWVEYIKYKDKPLMFEKKFSRRKKNWFQENLKWFQKLTPG